MTLAGRFRASEARATTIGVIAVAISDPLSQNIGTTTAATTAETLEMMRVCSERLLLFSSGSRLTPSTLALDPRAGDDVVGAVLPPHPGLVAAVVVGAPEHERRGVAKRRAALRALLVEAAPDAHERVRLQLLGDRAGIGVTRPQDGLARQRQDHVHDRVLEIAVGRRSGRPDPADGALEQRVAGEQLL